MKIIYLASIRIPNEKASALAILRQCEAFAESGHEVTLLRPFRKNPIMQDPFDYYGIDPTFSIKTIHSPDFIQYLNKYGFYFTRLLQMFYVTARVVTQERKADLIYTRDPWMMLLILAFGMKKKIILEVHKTYNNMFVHFVIKHIRTVVCITHGLRKHYEDLTGRQDIIVEPSGVHLRQFDIPRPSDEIRKEFRIPTDKEVVGYIGKVTTMGEEKGVQDLIDAFARIYSSDKHVHLLIVGIEEHEWMDIEKTCRNLSLNEDAYTLLPLVQKRFAEYAKMCDVLVMNYPDTEHYRTYMSPTKLFAYIGSRRIVVTTDLPSVREIVDDSMVFFAVPGDRDSLQRKINEALSSNEAIETMKKHAYARIEDFVWEKRAKRILNKFCTVRYTGKERAK